MTSPWRWRVVLPSLKGAVADADGPRAWWGRSHAMRAATTHPACGGRGRRVCPRHWTAATLHRLSFHPGRSDGAERAPCGWSQGVPVSEPGTASATYFGFLGPRCRYPASGRTKGVQGGPTSTHWAHETSLREMLCMFKKALTLSFVVVGAGREWVEPGLNGEIGKWRKSLDKVDRRQTTLSLKHREQCDAANEKLFLTDRHKQRATNYGGHGFRSLEF